MSNIEKIIFVKFKYILAKYTVKAGLYAQIAQLVEQGTENSRVAGPIPALGTILGLFTASCSLDRENA